MQFAGITAEPTPVPVPAYVRFCAGLRFRPPARRCQGAMQERFSLGGVSLVSAPYPANLAVTSLIVEGGFGSKSAVPSTTEHSRSTFNCGRTVTLPKPP
jgi:hypothetical protein